MPRIIPLHWKILECIFLACGFVFVRQTASHRVYEKDGVLRPVIIPVYDSISPDITTGLIRTAGITRDEFFKLLDDCK